MSDHSRNQNLMEKEGSIIKELFTMAIGCKGKDKAKVNNTLYNLNIVFKVSIPMVWKVNLESILEKWIIKYLFMKALLKMASFTVLAKSK